MSSIKEFILALKLSSKGDKKANYECELKETKMFIETKKGVMNSYGQEDQEGTGKIVSLSPTPAFALRGLKNLKNRPLPSVITSPISIAKNPNLTLNKECQIKTKVLRNQPYKSDSDRVHIEMECASRWQDLGTYDVVGFGDADDMALVWAGDLDGDGKVDLLLDTHSRRGEGTRLQLFLSTSANDGCLLGEAAEFNHWDPNNPGC